MSLIPLSAIADTGHQAPAGVHVLILGALIVGGLIAWGVRRRSR